MNNNKSMDDDVSNWYSTYGLVTIERIFALMKIRLSVAELHMVSRSKNSPYYQLLQIPLKNIFNGIIMSQTNDYREFAQKMLIDYLLSGAANLAPEQTKPEGVRLELDLMRTDLIESAEQFDLLQFEHFSLINESQKTAIETAQTLPVPRVLLDEALSLKVMESMRPFIERAEAVNQKILGFRKQFYDIILKARERLDTVPDYFNQFETQPEHMEALNFNAKLGEEAKE